MAAPETYLGSLYLFPSLLPLFKVATIRASTATLLGLSNILQTVPLVQGPYPPSSHQPGKSLLPHSPEAQRRKSSSFRHSANRLHDLVPGSTPACPVPAHPSPQPHTLAILASSSSLQPSLTPFHLTFLLLPCHSVSYLILFSPSRVCLFFLSSYYMAFRVFIPSVTRHRIIRPHSSWHPSSWNKLANSGCSVMIQWVNKRTILRGHNQKAEIIRDRGSWAV